MSHKNKVSLRQQVAHNLNAIFVPGRSKNQDKQDGVDTRNFIYSYGTFNGYKQNCIQFVDWAKANHKCKTLDDCRPFVQEYLSQYEEKSAYTFNTKLAALAKLYRCRNTDLSPSKVRHRSDITRTRTAPGKQFEQNHADLVRFCSLTGLRRHELVVLKGTDIAEHNGVWAVHVKRGKGGKERWSVIAGSVADVRWIREKMTAAGEDKVFPDGIPQRFPVHFYRAKYADAIYDSCARDFDTCQKTAFYNPEHWNGKGQKSGGWEHDSVYWLREDRQGEWLDKQALLFVSRQLGHNRIRVAAEHYIHNIKN